LGRQEPCLHVEGIAEEEIEEGGRIGRANRLPGEKADGKSDEREHHEGKRQPSWIRAVWFLKTEPLAHAHPPWPSTMSCSSQMPTPQLGTGSQGKRIMASCVGPACPNARRSNSFPGRSFYS